MGHSHEHADSGDTEFYTPPEIIEAARVTMGSIDLDPASNAIANEVVGAWMFFTKEEDGLKQRWFDNVWMNHPFTKGENGFWIDKLIDSYLVGDIDAACCITWANIDTGWFEPLLKFPQCFPHGRIHYRQPDGTTKRGAPKGSVITYLGPDVDAFAAAFKHIGTVKVAV
jgi:hypothetical protein